MRKGCEEMKVRSSQLFCILQPAICKTMSACRIFSTFSLALSFHLPYNGDGKINDK